MQEKLILKVREEYADKLKDIDPKTIMIYAMIVSYVMREKIDDKYADFLLSQENTLDFLYDVYSDAEVGRDCYEMVKNALKNDQMIFLITEI